MVERRKDGDNRPFINRHRPVVSVIIVNFNAGPLLSKAVESVLSSSITVEVFVSDNGSTDGSLLSLRAFVGVDTRLQIIENRRNLGFARASNIALKQAQGEYILLLNPDAVIKPDTLARMLEVFAAYPETGMAGCLLRNPDGTEQIGCRRNIPTPWRSLVRVLRLGKLSPGHPRFRNFILSKEPLPKKPIFIEAISGAFMLVRRRPWNRWVQWTKDIFSTVRISIGVCAFGGQAGRFCLCPMSKSRITREHAARTGPSV